MTRIRKHPIRDVPERLVPARLGPLDTARVGGSGLRARPARVLLSAFGIAIGIAAMVAVVGISSSSRAEVDRRLARIGTDVLAVAPAKDSTGDQVPLPDTALAMIRRTTGVLAASPVGEVKTAVYRNDHVPRGNTNGISVLACEPQLPAALRAGVALGRWFTPATARGDTVVLGATTAWLLGLRRPGPDVRVWLGERWFTVIGILKPAPLAPALDDSALIGWAAAGTLGFDGHPTTLWVRTAPHAVAATRDLLARAASPEFPHQVAVERPSDALAAKEATGQAFSGLLLGLGGVALLVGGVGVANTMVISVLERRGEIGLRRSLGATRGQIRLQFLSEALLLSTLGGIGGVLLGAAVTVGYAVFQGWPAVVPGWLPAGGVAATTVIGVLSGVYPAVRAARMSPTEALAR